jgi:hypothetical protein
MVSNKLRQTFTRWGLPITGIVLFLVILSVIFASNRHSASHRQKPVVGHNGSPLLGFYYAAEKQHAFTSLKFNSTSDAGYALLSGTLDAGFIEPEKILELSRLKGFDKFVVLGKVTFPYGVTLITKKGSTLRLQDINGRSIAVPSDNTRLLFEFRKALVKYPLILDKIHYRFLPSDAIIPALETGVIDGAIMKGSRAVIAINEGHNMLFQKWDMEPGNECCPPVIDQLEFLLLGRKGSPGVNAELTKLLTISSAYDPIVLRAALSKAEHVPDTLFSNLPLASFEPADNQLLNVIARHSGASHNKENNHYINAINEEPHVHDASCEHQPLRQKLKEFFDQAWESAVRILPAK